MIEKLELVEQGKIDTLIVMMPPGAAKSTYVNLLFPSWFMVRHPTKSLITASHSTELAETWGRKTRNLVGSHESAQGVDLAGDNTAAHRWAMAAGGQYYAVGVGVGIAGFRADGGIVDDPFGSRQDAESAKIRQNVWNWYTDDFRTRQKPGAWEVIMHTRWHDDDLAGRKIKQMEMMGRKCEILCLPAEALPNDPLGRPVGEMLWSGDSYGFGEQLKLRKAESDVRTWSSLFQQNPVPDEGDYFKSEWIKPVELKEIPDRRTLRIYGGSDYAVTGGGGDYTVHAVVGVDTAGDPWLLDLWRKQASSDEWVESFCDLVIKYKPSGWAEEQGQIKSGVGPFLIRTMRERRAHVVREAFPTRGDKAVRAQSFRALIATRGLRVPKDAPWAVDFTAELLRFPAGVNDDQVDAVGLIGQLLDKVSKGRQLPPPAPPKKDTSYRWKTERDSAPSIVTL